MSPRAISEPAVREAPLLRAEEEVASAVRRIVDSGLPALPVVDEHARLVGLFGEREFFAAVFPGYVGELRFAGSVGKSLEHALEKRAGCRHEPVRDHMNTEHVDVDEDFSDVQVAEVFMHHRVLIVPVTSEGHHVVGVITRADFFRAVADFFLSPSS